MTTQGHGRDAAAEERANALEVLGNILRLQLTPARWDRIAAIMDVAIAAEAAADLDGVWQATDELDLIGPIRVVRIGGTPIVPPPPPVRERVEALQAALLAASTDAELDEDEQ